jgi:selenocysteine lyase/cysteine desulfurase
MHTLSSLAASPNSLAPYYRDFRVHERLLFTGHSHQAWPDCTREAILLCHADAAELVDDKWERAFERAERVRAGFRAWLGGEPGDITLGANTHELVVRFLSALPLRERPRLVTSDAEFHSLRRQLMRLAEEGIELVRVPASPVQTLSERLRVALLQAPERTAAVLVSTVLFTTSEVVPELARLLEATEREGVPLLLDAYHQLGVVPWPSGLARAFVVGGGYKYLQLGEGNCFLRAPEGCTLRPVITGWFAEFAALDRAPSDALVGYPRGPLRFAGSTYDPVSHYRAARVMDFFVEQGLDGALLRANGQRQLTLLRARFLELELPVEKLRLAASCQVSGLGGFLALLGEHASSLCSALKARGVATDARGPILRFGPAPYLSDAQLHGAMDALGECALTVC